MAGRRARKTAKAEADLSQIATHLAIESGTIVLAERFLDCAEIALDTLLYFPQVGHSTAWRNSALKNVRSWPVPHFPTYLIFYKTTPGGILVLRVLHGGRDIRRHL